MHIVVDRAACAGCHICELACSFHHFGHFRPRRSSIEIRKDPRTRDISPKVFHEATGERPACDRCSDLHTPVCASNCPASAISIVATDRSEEVRT